MTPSLAQIGAILYQLGAIAGLFLISPVLYGLVVVMRRWWLVVAAALLLCAGITWLASDRDIAAWAEQIPTAMQPDVQAYLGIAIGYVVLATLVRLSTLRLEWLGWQRRSIKDVHVLGFLAPTTAAVVMSVMPM